MRGQHAAAIANLAAFLFDFLEKPDKRQRITPEPAGDSPVIQAVHKVPPVFGAESAKCQTIVYNKMYATD
jgi:hypothetical protein